MRPAPCLTSQALATAVALAVTLLSGLGGAGCDEPTPTGPPPARFDTVKPAASATTTGAYDKAASAFCELQFPAAEGARAFPAPPERPVPGLAAAAAPTKGAWRWVNLWATWCHPCVDEMGLLARWEKSLHADGVAVDLELWSVDDDEPALTGFLQSHKPPGSVRWLRSAADLGPVLESLGTDRNSAIPVHALVDSSNHLRCVRVGSVHDEDYAAIKALLAGT